MGDVAHLIARKDCRFAGKNILGFKVLPDLENRGKSEHEATIRSLRRYEKDNLEYLNSQGLKCELLEFIYPN
ncbi:MAG: hypothetical protein AABW50_02535 [Nanoarchaeota archaeon]